MHLWVVMTYVWLFPFEEKNAENAAEAILECSSIFAPPSALMSDCGSHFQNETFRFVSRGLNTNHPFPLPYTPWYNGGIESLNKEVLRIFRAMLSEMPMDHSDWPESVQIVQSLLNNSASPQRKRLATITIFTGLEAKSLVSTILQSSTGGILTLNTAQRERFMAQKQFRNCTP